MGLLRYLLASLVMASHLGHSVFGLNPGVVAVVVFYMLAGDVVAGLWMKWRGQPGGVGHFYADRLWRILPQYYLAALVAIALWLAGAQSPFLAMAPGWQEWLYQLTVIPLAYYMNTGAEGFALIPPAWSLAVELQFYLLAPCLVLLPPRLFGWVMAASLAVFAAAQTQWLHTDHFGYRLLPGVLFVFLTGAALRRRTLSLALGALWLLMCIYLVALCWGLAPVPYRREVVLGFVAGVPLLAALGRNHQQSVQPLPYPRHGCSQAIRALERTLANASYGIFLWHFPVMWLLGVVPPAHSTGQLLQVWLMSTACALAAHHAFERPLWARYRRFNK